MGGGGKGTTTTNTIQDQNQTYSAAAPVQAASNQALSAAQTAAATPFSQPVAPVAGFNPTQQQAFNQYQNIQGMASPYYQQASGLYGQSAQSPNVASFYNPMAANVTAQLQNIFGEQNQQNTGSLVNAAGGVGADRIAVGQGDLANQQTLAAGQTYANLYQQATSAAQAQQQFEQGAAAGVTNLGTTAENTALQGTQALLGSGNQQQQQTQAQLNAPYQNILAQLAYPFQTAQYLSGITGQQAPVQGGTTTGAQGTNQQATPAQPTLLSQLLGAGTAGAGLYGAINGGTPNAYGGGSAAAGDAYGGSAAAPLAGLTPLDYAARGGEIKGYDDGGDAGPAMPAMPPPPNVTSAPSAIVPNMPFSTRQPGGGHSGPLTGGLTFSNPSSPQSSTSNNSVGNDISTALGVATKIIPFLGTGGKVKGYASDGAVDAPDDLDFTKEFSGPTFNDLWGARVARPPDDPTPTPTTPEPPPGPILRPGSIADRFNNWLTGGSSTTAPVTPQAPNSAYAEPEFKNPHPIAPGTTPLPVNSPLNPPGSHPEAYRLDPSAKSAPNDSEPDLPPPPPNKNSSPAQIRAAMMPANQQPYPDALQRDWGQQAARSPWLALVQMGAKMMTTPGPLGSAIGQGLMAGTKTIDDQRKELRSEQELNDKAEELYEKAADHLDKYNKMTPYERGSLNARNQEINQGYSATQKALDAKTKFYYGQLAARPENINKTPQQIQAMATAMANGAMPLDIPAAGSVSGAGPGSSAATAVPDPGPGKRVIGQWYIGPSGQPQPWQ